MKKLLTLLGVLAFIFTAYGSLTEAPARRAACAVPMFLSIKKARTSIRPTPRRHTCRRVFYGSRRFAACIFWRVLTITGESQLKHKFITAIPCIIS